MDLVDEVTMKRVGQNLPECDSPMRRMFSAHVKAAHDRLNLENLVCVEAHEMKRRKGHNDQTLFGEFLARLRNIPE